MSFLQKRIGVSSVISCHSREGGNPVLLFEYDNNYLKEEIMENYPPPDQDSMLTSLKGQFLISMPGLADPNFFKTVICICEHSPEGAVGIVINRVHPNLLSKDIFDELKMDHIRKMENIPVYLGGPVHTNEIYILHGPPFGWDRCLMVTPTLAMSNTRYVLEAAVQGKGPGSFIISLGCAGWGPGQLEAELRSNAWLTGQISEEIIFDMAVDVRWEEAVRNIGIEPSLLSETAGNA